MNENEGRAAVIAEAKTWIGTPFKHESRIKGAGCDCGEFLIACYSAAGLMPDYNPPHVPEQWHLHKDAPGFDPEMYLRQIEKFAHEIPANPGPGDIAMFWWGHAYSHSAIVVRWPTELVHCFFVAGVQFVNAEIDPYLKRFRWAHPPRFFSVFGPPR
jgi:cell wall-associated NlpC family hydrolase